MSRCSVCGGRGGATGVGGDSGYEGPCHYREPALPAEGVSVKLVNLTPHEINIRVEVMPTFVAAVDIPPSGNVPRCSTESALSGHVTVDGVAVPVYMTSVGAVTGLPDPAEGVAYIVSRIVAEACTDRTDLYIPGEAVRDGAGRVIGCRGLCRIA